MKELERDLGLPSVTAISIGAMVGSGIFILPGLAMKMAGPAVVFAYFLAGLLVVPAALSKSEMATAMPEAGGTYLYIERAMGPLFGTIAGVGTWFSLIFKGALALVGGAPYLVLILEGIPATPLAFGVAIVLIVVNIVGVKQTGRMQIAIVAIMLAVMIWFILAGAPSVEGARFEGFFDSGFEGIVGATGFVFVSYAGVTKIASVAEEVENPDRNLPLGILGSLVITTVIYIAIVSVMVGVAPQSDLTGTDTPMQVAADNALPAIGVTAVIVAALLALISTANAGILSSSRYPFAMSRDDLAPDLFESVSDRFDTPVNAITLTGIVLLGLLLAPVDQIAKFASAFQILVFILINAAVIAFRQGSIEAYDPSFESPLYPLPQLVGIVGGVVLLRYIGLVPLLGSVVIIAGSMAWYYAFVYRRGGVDREGAMTDALRRSVGNDLVKETESEVDTDGHEVLVAVTETTQTGVERSLIDLATDLARTREGGIRVAQFDETPDQTPLPQSAGRLTRADQAFEARMADRTTDSEIPIRYGEVVSHDSRHAIVNYAADVDADTLIIEQATGSDHLLGNDADWIEDHAPCDVIEISNLDHDAVERIGVVTDEGPFDPEKVALADALATAVGATITFYFPIGSNPPESQKNTTGDYLNELVALCEAPAESQVVESDTDDAIKRAATDSNVLVVSGIQRGLTDRLFGGGPDPVEVGTEHGTLVIYGATRPGRLRRAVEKRLF
jgi:amino acid transporter